jgi:hypothetical protein
MSDVCLENYVRRWEQEKERTKIIASNKKNKHTHTGIVFWMGHHHLQPSKLAYDWIIMKQWLVECLGWGTVLFFKFVAFWLVISFAMGRSYRLLPSNCQITVWSSLLSRTDPLYCFIYRTVWWAVYDMRPCGLKMSWLHWVGSVLVLSELWEYWHFAVIVMTSDSAQIVGWRYSILRRS